MVKYYEKQIQTKMEKFGSRIEHNTEAVLSDKELQAYYTQTQDKKYDENGQISSFYERCLWSLSKKNSGVFRVPGKSLSFPKITNQTDAKRLWMIFAQHDFADAYKVLNKMATRELQQQTRTEVFDTMQPKLSETAQEKLKRRVKGRKAQEEAFKNGDVIFDTF